MDVNRNRILGVDFDNTIVSYDDLLYGLAETRGLIEPEVHRGKKGVRDAVRELPGGEVLWQKLQAEIYGPRMPEARLMEGVVRFFTVCRKQSVRVYIVSHKTEFANQDKTGTNLRTAALKWLESQGFFSHDGLGLDRESVFFESTRQAKIERIKSLACTHFIDDLEETFLEDSFSSDVVKILLDPHHSYSPRPGIMIYSSWSEIASYFFGEGA